MDVLRAGLPLRDGEDIEDRVAQLRAIDLAASTLGDDGWQVRANCAKALRDFTDRSASARAALESILDDTSEAFRSPVQPRGAADAWVYAKHGLGQLDDVMKWIEERAEEEPRHSSRYAASSSSMEDAIVAAGRYDALGHVHRDLKQSALRTLHSHERTRKILDEQRGDAEPQRELSDRRRFLYGELSANRRAVLHTVDRVGMFHAGLLVTGDANGATEVANALLEAHDLPEARVALAKHALRAGVAGQMHAGWLAEAMERVHLDIREVERLAAGALMAQPIRDDFAFDPAEATESLNRLEASHDPAERENAKLLRERLKPMFDAARSREEPPY
jgi:hypothetical protein